MRRNEDYDAEAAARHNAVYRTVLCCLVLCIFCCMVVAFAALAFGLFGPGALVWILLLVVGTNPTTLFQNISQLRNEKDMADRNKAFGNKRSIEARK